MTLTPGTRLGWYEIVDALGAGGMGEVYRARDTKLGRSVAVKVLPEAVALDPDRIARFEREARALAALNHPHIAALFGMEVADPGAITFLVMELVEGDTLADRLSRGAMPLEEGLRVAIQIAEALEAAHEKGIVHRDLKPANVKITPDDKVKVLDFGLAKLGNASLSGELEGAGQDLTRSAALTMMATEQGVILGTAAYMSPEQAKGLPADHRSDVFSFGVVLYELLTGRQPFQGETPPDIMASVLAREPDLATLPADLHPRLVELLKRCLEKHPRKRWQAIGDVRAELEMIATNPRALPFVAAAVVAPPIPIWRRAVPIGITALVVGVAGAALAWYVKPAPGGIVTRFSIPLPDEQHFTNTGRQAIAISPDGSQIVYVANQRLFHRSMDEAEARPIPGTDGLGAVSNPVFSPDGKSIAFHAGADLTLKRIPVTGGTPITVASTEAGLFGISWEGDDILYSLGPNGIGPNGIMRVSASGGAPEILVRTKDGEIAFGPHMLPDGDGILFTIGKTSLRGLDRWEKAQVVVQSLKTGARKVVVDPGSDGRYLPSGHFVFAVGGVLFASPFDLKHSTLTKAPTAVVEGVQRAASGVTQYSVAADGTLIYLPGSTSLGAQVALAVLDPKSGAVTPLALPSGFYEQPRLSPDGKRVAFSSDDGKEAVVWIYELSGATSMRKLTLGGRNRFPVWSADGLHVAFQSDREGDQAIFWQRADGVGLAERLTKPETGASHLPESWSPDGKFLLFTVTVNRPDEFKTLWMLSMPERTVSPAGDAKTGVFSLDASFSPDGRFIAYYSMSRAVRGARVYVQPFPPDGTKYELGGVGIHPAWSSDGKQLYDSPSEGRFGVIPIVTQPSVAFGNVVTSPLVFADLGPGYPRDYDVARTGATIGLIAAKQVTAIDKRIDVVLHWFDELKQRVPAK